VPDPTLAAITLDPPGGGVAAVARLIWRLMGETWGDRRRLVAFDRRTLSHPADSSPGLGARVAFGWRLGASQVSRPGSWVFFSHLSLARVQSYVPSPLRRPYAVFLHGIEAWRPLSESERDLLRRAALRVANSQYTASRVATANPGIGPIETCPLALEPDDRFSIDRMSAPPRVTVGPHAVLLVGRMASGERYKGHDALLEAWPRVTGAMPDAQLVFAGEGDDRTRLMAKAAALGVGDRVIFPGFLAPEALDALYNHAAIFAMPSRGEGFGLVYLEAMAHGLPCIGSIHDAAREVIEDDVTGYLMDQSNIPLLADRLSRLLADDGLRARLGAAGRRRVDLRFTYAQFSHRLLDLVSRSLGTKAPALPAVSRVLD